MLSSTPMFAKNIEIVSSGNDYGSNNVAGGAATGEPEGKHGSTPQQAARCWN